MEYTQAQKGKYLQMKIKRFTDDDYKKDFENEYKKLKEKKK